ncbi:MAG TPA: protein kinase [Gemmatimonadales bacterium]|nr:protein kinase [Gemmatimonadales bacterium]
MINRVLSHYRIIQELGAGGMGVVYLAEDVRLGRRVALKLLPPEHTQDEDRLRRFQQEARAASALNHPNILTIHEVGEEDGHHFIVTEFIDGESLRTVLHRTGTLAFAQALDAAVQVASALAAAHEAGIIHRDIKPENIMLRRDGYVKVLDFGLAKLTETATTPATPPVALTESGVVLGTAQYMSPEQAAGRTVDARSDIFSFGAMLYEMVTGQPAFQGDSPMETVAAVLVREPRPLPDSIHPGLSSVILRCLRKDPARRYQSMADLKVAVEDIREELTSGTRLRQVRQRRRLVGAVLLPVVLAGAFFAVWAWRSPRSAVPLEAVPLTTLRGVQRYPSFSPDGERVAFTWNGPRQDNPDLYVHQIGSTQPLRLTSDSANDFNPVWSPDGRWIAFLRSHSEPNRSEVRLIAPLGGPERKLAEIHLLSGLDITPPYLAWCPDNSCLVVTDSPGKGLPDALFAIGLETGERRQLTRPQPPAGGDSHPAVSPDGRWLVFRRMAGLYVGELYRLSLAKGITAAGEPERLTVASLDAQHPAWMPNSREIVFSARSGLWRLPVPGTNTPARLPFVGDYGLMPAVSRPQPGRSPRLVYVRNFLDANIWRVETSAPGAPAATPPAVAISSTRLDDMPQFSPEGRRVAFTSDRSGNWEIWQADPDGSNAVQLTSMGAVAAGYPHWSPDGQQIVFHSNVDGQWEVYLVPAAGGKPRNLTSHPAPDAMPSFSRDGRWVYFSSARTGEQYQSVWKIPAAGGSAVQLTKGAGYAPQESRDGESIYYVEAIDRPSTLWRVPRSGGTPVKVLDGVLLANFAVLTEGIYYIDQLSGQVGTHYVDQPTGETRLRYFDFATGKSTTVASNLGSVDLPLTVSSDGRTILFPRLDASTSDLMLVADFR